jgi:UDP-N-acetylmuramate dehydrogenase
MTSYPPRELSQFNTLQAPAKAEHFFAASSVSDVRRACNWAQKQGLPVWVLGEGSNVVAADFVRGLVLKPEITGVATIENDGECQVLEVGAGENWHQFVNYCLDHDLYGPENLSLIPGSVGAAPVQNIGAYGVELSQFFVSLRAVDIATGDEGYFSHADCAFGYRDSVFKNGLRGRYVITHVRFRLLRKPALNLSYPALAEALAGRENLTPADVGRAVCEIRQQKLPDPAVLPNCGSFFKNPVVQAELYRQLLQRHPDLVAFAQPESRYKLAAAWLIDRAGWKGKSCLGITVHRHQALVLTNPQRLPASTILAAAGAIQADIAQKFGVELEIEPQLLGELAGNSRCNLS